MNTQRLLFAILFVSLATAASARPFVDQQSPYGTDTIVVGNEGAINRVVAQTVTAGVTGDLMRVELTVGCDGGALILEIVNLAPRSSLPGTVVRSRTTIDAASIPNPPAVHTFELDRWPSMSEGDEFAIMLRNEGGSCAAVTSTPMPDGSSYPDGHGFFRSATSSGWFQFLDFLKTGDLGFKTIVNVPVPSPPCIVHGIATPFSGFLPVCRCLQDDGLRDFRCALLHPSYFLSRHLPSPIHVNEKFKVKWTLTVFAPMEGVVEIDDTLPPGFIGAPKVPLTFFVGQVPAGESITLEYEVVAPSKAGRYKLETGVEEGSMQTFVDVIPSAAPNGSK